MNYVSIFVLVSRLDTFKNFYFNCSLLMKAFFISQNFHSYCVFGRMIYSFYHVTEGSFANDF